MSKPDAAWAADGAPPPQHRRSQAALYVVLEGRQEALVAKAGETLDGGSIEEFGTPALASGALIVVGVKLRHGRTRRWALYEYDASGDRPPRALVEPCSGAACEARLIGDPHPAILDPLGVAFGASDRNGQQAIFVASEGRLSCVVRTNTQTLDRHTLNSIDFASLRGGAEGEFVFKGRLANGKDAIFQAGLGRGLTEIAVEGGTAPGGARFHALGYPTARAWGGSTAIAFMGRTFIGDALFLEQSHTMRRVLADGMRSSLGTLDTISDGPPGLMTDGTMVTLALCEHRPTIFILGARRVAALMSSGQPLEADVALTSFGDPLISETGAVYFAATDSMGTERIYSLSSDSEVPAPLGLSRRELLRVLSESHRVYGNTLSIDSKGDAVYLGSS